MEFEWIAIIRFDNSDMFFCKREGNKSRWEAGFSPSWVCHVADNSVLGCRYLPGDAHVSSLPGVHASGDTRGIWYTCTFMGCGDELKPIWTIISLKSNGIYNVPFLGVITDTSTNTIKPSPLEHIRIPSNTPRRHIIARVWGRVMGCLLWVSSSLCMICIHTYMHTNAHIHIHTHRSTYTCV